MSQLNYEQLGQVPLRRRRPAALVDYTGRPAEDGPAAGPAAAAPATIRRFEIDLAVAHAVGGAAGAIVLDVAGTVVWCAKSSDAAMCDVQIDANDPIPFALHYNIQGTPFRRLQITNAAQAGKTLTLIVVNDPTNRTEVQ